MAGFLYWLAKPITSSSFGGHRSMSGFTSSLPQLAWDKRLCCGGANCLIVSETMKRKGWICRRSKTDKDQELIPCFWHMRCQNPETHLIAVGAIFKANNSTEQNTPSRIVVSYFSVSALPVEITPMHSMYHELSPWFLVSAKLTLGAQGFLPLPGVLKQECKSNIAAWRMDSGKWKRRILSTGLCKFSLI
jgi:hypothetical protein